MDINRLNLPNIVNKHFHESTFDMQKHYKPEFILGKYKKQRDYEINPNAITTSFNSIVATVHRNLQVNKPYNSNKTNRTEALTSQPPLSPLPSAPPPPPPQIENNPLPSKKCKKIKPGQNAFNCNLKKLMPLKAPSISQLKARREQQALQHQHCKIACFSNLNNYTNQQRAREVLRQRRILEDMLTQHKKLRKDRQSIALEIQAMRNHLNDIRDKLDNSMKKLNSQHTISENYPRPKKYQRSNNGQRRKICFDDRIKRRAV